MPASPPFDAQVTFCYSADLPATARFYEELLGLPLALDQGVCRLYRVAPGAYLGFCRREDAPRPRGVLITLVTHAVDEWYAQLRDRGVAFEKAPAHNARYNVYHCLLRDPNGYMLEIQRFEDTAWRG